MKRCIKTGTIYRQTINITKETFDKLADCLRCKLVLRNKRAKVNVYRQMFLSSQLKFQDRFVFMNRTQTDFFNKYLKLKLLDRNTCFYIIDGPQRKYDRDTMINSLTEDYGDYLKSLEGEELQEIVESGGFIKEKDKR